jgi:hypothetical protein
MNEPVEGDSIPLCPDGSEPVISPHNLQTVEEFPTRPITTSLARARLLL